MAKNKIIPVRLSAKEAAAYCGVTLQHIYQCRTTNSGPQAQLVQTHGLGKGPTMRLFYDRADLDEWNAARREKAKPSKTRKPPKKQQNKKQKKAARSSPVTPVQTVNSTNERTSHGKRTARSADGQVRL